MDFNLDDNIIWLLVILALVFLLFPQKNISRAEEKVEEKEKYDYIYRRKRKEKRRLVY